MLPAGLQRIPVAPPTAEKTQSSFLLPEKPSQNLQVLSDLFRHLLRRFSRSLIVLGWFRPEESAEPYGQRNKICHRWGIDNKIFEFCSEYGTEHKRYQSAN